MEDFSLKDLVALGLLGVIVYAIFGNVGLAVMALVLLLKYAKSDAKT